MLGWVLTASREQCREQTQSHPLLQLQNDGTRREGDWEDKGHLGERQVLTFVALYSPETTNRGGVEREAGMQIKE